LTSEVLQEVRHRLVNMFLWYFVPDSHASGLEGDFRLIKFLELRSLWYFSGIAHNPDDPAGSNMQNLGPDVLLGELGTVRLLRIGHCIG